MPFKLNPDQLVTNERLEHERLTSLINSMADAVVAVDEAVNVVLYNAAALNVLDLNNIQPGTALDSLFKLVDKENQAQNITKLVQTADKPLTSRDLRLKYDDGSFINLYVSIAPVHLGYGKNGQKGYVLLLRDITREKSLEEERDEFISVVSHELRTPIAIAEGNISNAKFLAAKTSDMPDIITSALTEAHKQVLFLADMINDLSTLSRAERGKLQIEAEPIDVKQLVAELIESYKPEAAAKKLGLKSTLDPKLKDLHSSRLYVREILQNFITNALKYTAEGHITISASAHPKGVSFAVHDTGIGISKGDQERVFDKFFRSEDFRTRQANGTGLGLYVTMKLIRLIHAEVEVDSELNKGSTFTMFVPNLD
ncbi:hypothetical protein COY17_02465 [Candidatus Saccharibacteria bacterium CG_4_10_14_0_2_um_filter_52_9]|nr:MAG: hypothetical protein COY17_02465 [Candidatus Saccharibacteria bacterium CG_4_10_14_0_2_um_filter_52_9]